MKDKDINVKDFFCPDLYVGELFEEGYKGCRILVIGHQAPATDGEEDKFKNKRAQFEKEYKNNNIELVKDNILEEKYKTWKKEYRRRTNTWQKFINIIHYPNKPALDSYESKYLLKHIAFANYLTKPCFNKNRMGIDDPDFYTNDQNAFEYYINEAFKNNEKPNILVVWGKPYEYIRNMAKEVDNEQERHCVIRNTNNATIHVIGIYHPMVANQKETNIIIGNLIKTLKEHAIL
jgi:hypothetical protein